MPHAYRIVVKGTQAQAVRAAQGYGFTGIQIVQVSNGNVILTVHSSEPDDMVLANWMAKSPPKPPFQAGTLLFYKDEESGAEKKKVWIAKHGWSVDDDLEGLGREKHHYRATIKGNAAQAVAAAQSHGFLFKEVIREDTRNGYTIIMIETSDTNHKKRIAHWFDKPAYQPYPIGTLIFFWDEKEGVRVRELQGLDPRTKVVEYDVGEAVVYVYPGGRYNRFQVELMQLRNGKPTVVWSEAVEEHAKEDAARVALIRANRIGIVTGLTFDRLRDAIRSQRAGVPHKKSWKVDDDLEGLRSFHPWSVSTLVPGLHGKPRYRYFDDFGDALAYARDRVRKGKRLREGGKAYFILSHTANPDGVAAYRVFRAFLRAEQRPGNKHYIDKPEYVLVQEASGVMPDDPVKTRWKVNKAHSVEILSAETERARQNPFPRR